MLDRLFSSYGTSHCVLSLSKTLYLQFSTGPTKEDSKSFRHYCKTVDWDVKHKNEPTKSTLKLR